MKKFVASILALLLLLSTVAFADTITIDTATASDEEIQATITLLRSVLSERNVELNTLPQSFTFDNGYFVSVDGYTINNGFITMQYSFSHQNETPKGYDLWDRLFQNGVELDADNTLDDYASDSRTALKGGILHVTQTFVLADDSPITVYLTPWFGSTQSFSFTFSLNQL